jgi:hypothetical protein
MFRILQILVLFFTSVLLAGCDTPEQKKPVWDEVSFGDLTAADNYPIPRLQPLNTINFDVHIFEIPFDNVGKLNSIWNFLYSRPIRFNSYRSFTANSFMARFGQAQMWDKIQELLASAGGPRALKISLLMSNNRSNDITISGLDKQQSVYYISAEGAKETADIGPGMLVLRIKAVKVAGSEGLCIFVAQPVFTQPIRSLIPELAERAKLNEYIFRSAAFGLKISPGDFVVLGPENYDSSRSTLGGLFFGKPEGTLFFTSTERKMPEHRPAVRVLMLVCTGIGN